MLVRYLYKRLLGLGDELQFGFGNIATKVESGRHSDAKIMREQMVRLPIPKGERRREFD
jgi:hypothetical protein